MSRAFVFYPEWYDVIQRLETDEDRYAFLSAIIEYGVNGTYECDNPMVAAMVSGMIVPQIDRAQERYQEKVETGKKVGRRKVVDDTKVYQLAKSGLPAAAIAKELGVGADAIYHSEGWKRRYL